MQRAGCGRSRTEVRRWGQVAANCRVRRPEALKYNNGSGHGYGYSYGYGYGYGYGCATLRLHFKMLLQLLQLQVRLAATG